MNDVIVASKVMTIGSPQNFGVSQLPSLSQIVYTFGISINGANAVFLVVR